MTGTTPDPVSGSVSDSQLAALFAPAGPRQSLQALAAWHAEIAGLTQRISEPAIGAMRMAWHRDAIADAFAASPVVRRNPLIEGIAQLRDRPGAPTAEALIAIIDAHDADFEGRGFDKLDAMRRHADAGYGAYLRLAARLIDPAQESSGALHRAGEVWGIAEMVRAFRYRAARGLAIIPGDVLDMIGLTPARLASGQDAAAARQALGAVLDAGADALRAAQSDVRTLPPHLFAAWGHVALSRGYLKQAAKASDPYRSAIVLSPLTKQLTLMKASLTGRL